MKRVLMVDDREENLYLLRMLFEGNGYRVDCARHGAEALILARQQPPSLVVSDLLMPVMDGYTLLRHWKADPRLRHIPFVVYTATYTEPKDAQLALDLGADAFILKPAEPAPFMARIDAVLAQVARGQLVPARMPLDDEREVLKEYSEVLVRKLEQKALELERSNRELQQDIERRQRAEADALRYLGEAATSQAAQRLSAASYRMLFEHAPDGILIVDAQGVCLDANASVCRMLGYAREQLLGMPSAQFVAASAVADIAPALRDIQAGASYFREWQFQRRDGSVLPVEVIAATMPDGTVLGMIRDITERRRSETLLTGQRQVLEMIASGAALTDMLDALVRLVEALVPDSLGSILLLDDDGLHMRLGAAPSLPQSFSSAFDGEAIGAEAGSCGTAAFRREQVIVADIGSDPLWRNYREVALRYGLRACWSTPIFDQQQRVLGTFAFYFRSPQRPTDAHLQLIASVTHTAAIAIAKAREEAALMNSEKRLRLALDAAQMGSFDWDMARNRVIWSRWHEQLWGYEPGEFGGTFEAFAQRVHPEDVAPVNADVARAIAAREPFISEFRVCRPDASVIWVMARGEFVFDADGEAVRMYGVVLDISARKAAEAALRAYAAQLRELSWRMSVAEETERKAIASELHDRIGQNLAGLNLTLNLMRGQLSPESLRRVGAQMLDACALTAESIVQVRQVMAELRPPALDDYGLLAALRLYAERYAGRCGIAVTVGGGELVPRLPVDTELALFRIVQEALANVAKHAQARQVSITVEQIDAHVRLQIRDDGIGFVAPTEASGASGWGQMIMRERAQAIGATLRVQSASGSGTRVIVELERAP